MGASPTAAKILLRFRNQCAEIQKFHLPRQIQGQGVDAGVLLGCVTHRSSSSPEEGRLVFEEEYVHGPSTEFSKPEAERYPLLYSAPGCSTLESTADSSKYLSCGNRKIIQAFKKAQGTGVWVIFPHGIKGRWAGECFK